MKSAKEITAEFEKTTYDKILQRAYAAGFKAGVEKAAQEADGEEASCLAHERATALCVLPPISVSQMHRAAANAANTTAKRIRALRPEGE